MLKVAPRESKNEAFKRLAEQRTNKVLERLARLAPLANRASYDFDDEPAQIFECLRKRIDEIEAMFVKVERNQIAFRFGEE